MCDGDAVDAKKDCVTVDDPDNEPRVTSLEREDHADDNAAVTPRVDVALAVCANKLRVSTIESVRNADGLRLMLGLVEGPPARVLLSNRECVIDALPLAAVTVRGDRVVESSVMRAIHVPDNCEGVLKETARDIVSVEDGVMRETVWCCSVVGETR